MADDQTQFEGTESEGSLSDEQAGAIGESAVAGTEAEAGVSEEMPEMETPVEKPKSNIFTLLLIISILLIGVGIYLIGYELNKFYDVEFAGLFEASSSSPVGQ